MHKAHTNYGKINLQIFSLKRLFELKPDAGRKSIGIHLDDTIAVQTLFDEEN